VQEENERSCGKYTLVGIISHLGSSTAFGHYVCHIKRDDGRWYLFNDDKVGKSDAAKARQYGFMYLYARNDGPKRLCA
jgi:ubiquitin carboxyl-terminal hydrolase 5/13